MEALSGDDAPLLRRSDGSVLPPTAVLEALARVLADGSLPRQRGFESKLTPWLDEPSKCVSR